MDSWVMDFAQLFVQQTGLEPDKWVCVREARQRGEGGWSGREGGGGCGEEGVVGTSPNVSDPNAKEREGERGGGADCVRRGRLRTEGGRRHGVSSHS